MKKAQFTDSQIFAILKQAENGIPISELCREHGMSASLITRMKELEAENQKLKKT